ncbi:MAG: hypothetical protein ABJ242_02420 [Marinomonas sp.]
MKALCIAAGLALAGMAPAPLAPALAADPVKGNAGTWQVEPPGEGSEETYVYATSHGRFLAGPQGSGIWVVYGPRKPRSDGSCTFDSCIINVTLNGSPGYEQEWVKFAFSDGTSVTARPDMRSGQYNVINDYARVLWPEVAKIMTGLRSAHWVDVSFSDGNMRRFPLKGSSAALKRGAAAAGAE